MHRGIKVHGYPNIGAYIDIKAKNKFRSKHKCMDIDLGAWRQRDYFRKIRTVIDPLTL